MSAPFTPMERVEILANDVEELILKIEGLAGAEAQASVRQARRLLLQIRKIANEEIA